MRKQKKKVKNEINIKQCHVSESEKKIRRKRVRKGGREIAKKERGKRLAKAAAVL
jgi:hypothetical protein